MYEHRSKGPHVVVGARIPPRISSTSRVCLSTFPQWLRCTRLIIPGVTFPSSFRRQPNIAMLSDQPRPSQSILRCTHLQAHKQPQRDFSLSRAGAERPKRTGTAVAAHTHMSSVRSARGPPLHPTRSGSARCSCIRTALRGPCGRTASCEMVTWPKIEPVSKHRSASLFLMGGVVRPFDPFSRMKLRTLLSRLQRAHTTNMSL